MISILNWNIGCFSFLKFAKFIKLKYKNEYVLNEYFQPKINGLFISEKIKQINPHIVILQEIFKEKDINHINILKTYPYKKLINTWYHKHSILIASKQEFEIDKKDNFSIIKYEKYNIIPIHLNSFYANKRLKDIKILNNIVKDLKNVILIGDTNIWQKNNKFLFKNDKKAYKEITENLVDASGNIDKIPLLKFTLDKIFCSKNIKTIKMKSPKVRGHFMDHYPIYCELE